MNKPLSLLKGKARHYDKLSVNGAFKEVDGDDDDDNMNRILWFNAKGEIKYPASKQQTKNCVNKSNSGGNNNRTRFFLLNDSVTEIT